MKSAIIHFEPIFTKWDQSLFIKQTLKKVKSTIIVNDQELLIYKIPVWKENPSKKMMQRFISYLKEENVGYVLLSDSAASLLVSKMLENQFKIFSGSSVINYKLYDILRKCAKSRNIELSDSTLVLVTNEPEKAKKFILKVYKFVRKIKIRTDKPTKFSNMSSFFLHEYGLFIETVCQSKKKEQDILILLDSICGEVDFSVNYECKTEIIFSTKNYFQEITPYVKMNQMTVEFLIYQLYNNVSQKSIKSFFKTYPVRVIKLIK